MRGEADLFQVVLTGHASSRLTNFLDGGQEQADEDGDDRNHDEQLDQRERTANGARHRRTLQVLGLVSGVIDYEIVAQRKRILAKSSNFFHDSHFPTLRGFALDLSSAIFGHSSATSGEFGGLSTSLFTSCSTMLGWDQQCGQKPSGMPCRPTIKR
jgi:hypothetical protein